MAAADAASSENREHIKNMEFAVEFVKREHHECLVCRTQSNQCTDIFVAHTAHTATPLHSYLFKLTNIRLYDSEFTKHICKTCLDLVNDLEQAEVEYKKLKDNFEQIISKNPLFDGASMVQVELVENRGQQTAQCSWIPNDVKPESGVDREKVARFNTNIKLEPMSDEDERPLKLGQDEAGLPPIDAMITVHPVAPSTPKTKGGKPRKRAKKAKDNPTGEKPPPTSEKSYVCEICTRQFSQKGNYNRHLATHSGVMPFECKTCQRRFNRKDHLHNHMRTHTGERPFECNFCLLKFNQKGSIIKHLRTHTGQVPFECNVCQRRFKQRPHLNSHLKIHTGEKPYECKICQRRFIESSKLKVHLRTHTGEKPFKCTFCDRQFNQRGNLQCHMRTHTGEKPYECSVCQRRFNLKHHLRDHFTTHSGEKPYECEVCKLKFNYKHVMLNHIRVMHPPEMLQEMYPCVEIISTEPVGEKPVTNEHGENSGDDDNSERRLDDGEIIHPLVEVHIKEEPTEDYDSPLD